jgi:hypothetical protein
MAPPGIRYPVERKLHQKLGKNGHPGVARPSGGEIGGGVAGGGSGNWPGEHDGWTHRSLHPAFTGVRYARALVEMDEGPRVHSGVLSWVVDVAPDELELGMRVGVGFLDVDGTTLPAFARGDG